jgi:hypothetical protein
MQSIDRVVSKKKIIFAITLLACSTAALTGCSSTLDESKVEGSIKDGITTQTGLGVKSVSCPKDVKIEANNVEWNVNGLMSLTKVEQEIQQAIEKKLEMKVTADCDGKVKVVKSGDTFECKVTDSDGKAHAAKITATDNNGGFKWEI